METRSELRKKIMTILYQIAVFDKNKIEYNVDELIKENLEIENEFVKEIVYGTVTYKNELDNLANKYMKDWTIDRLGFTDIAILRMAIYELIYSNTPDIVVINEAIELAKAYSDDKVVKLINGVLDKIYHEEVNK
ncbi:transcription antitermination protein NusB [Firmicutes bacterium CAG:884]|nr:transcription antitermination factor NusB [Bacillota bacterium]CCY94676.1 transcription antitermination protein NusB [Firmicutes bacterium CAG:884]